MSEPLAIMGNNPKILLHTCCAPCGAYCIEKLISLGFEPILYFFNPNIFPQTENERRYFELKKYAEKQGLELILEKQNPAQWYDYIIGLEEEPEKGKRCERCFELRLLNTAAKALKLGIDTFTTTLSVSPHKNSNQIFQSGNKASNLYGVRFLEIDFKKEDGFLKAVKISKDENFYRQTYCGCEFSMG